MSSLTSFIFQVKDRKKIEESRWFRFLLFLLGVKRPRPGRLVDFRPSVTVLIPAFNEERTIAATVESARLQTYPVEEIIVVDDGSKDRTREIAEKAGAKVISTPQNTGLKAKALNFGLKDVKTEIVVMIDADTVLALDAIERILPGLSSDKVKVAGGVVLSTRMHSFWTKARSVQYLIAFGLVRKAQAHWNGILVCSGCFFAAKTKFLREIGGVPENTVGEDMALTWMAYLQGGEAEFIPAAKSYPVDPPTWRHYKHQTLRWFRGFMQCFKLFRKQLKRNRRVQFFAWYSLLAGLMSSVFWITLPIAIYFLAQNPNLTVIFVWFLYWLLNLLITMFIVMIEAHRYSLLKPALINFPLFWLVMIIDDFLFLSAFISEFILKTKIGWIKGH